MNGLLKAVLLGGVRTLAAGIVPTLIAAGVMQQNQTNDFIGSVVFLATVGFSALDKFVVNRKITVAAATGVVTQKVDLLQTPAAAVAAVEDGPKTMAPIPNPKEGN